MQQKKPTVENVKPDKKSEKTFASAPMKSRKIRIKKPGATSINLQPVKTMETTKTTEVKEDNGKKSISPVSDSRRVVVSTASASIVEPPAQPTTKSQRIPRRSTSHIDEAAFEPDYNDNDSEKALSNYAPSDIDDDTLVGKIDEIDVEPEAVSPVEIEKPRKRKKIDDVDMKVGIFLDISYSVDGIGLCVKFLFRIMLPKKATSRMIRIKGRRKRRENIKSTNITSEKAMR